MTGTSYTDTDVENGRTYYYVVRAVTGWPGERELRTRSAPIPHWTIAGLLLQWPPSITHTIQAGQPTETIYARVRREVRDDSTRATVDGVILQIGYGLPDTCPATGTPGSP